ARPSEDARLRPTDRAGQEPAAPALPPAAGRDQPRLPAHLGAPLPDTRPGSLNAVAGTPSPVRRAEAAQAPQRAEDEQRGGDELRIRHAREQRARVVPETLDARASGSIEDEEGRERRAVARAPAPDLREDEREDCRETEFVGQSQRV